MKPFKETITDELVYLFDGAMGTLLYEKGIPINLSYEESNIKNPSIVEEVHREYKNSGAQIITTNTFLANRVRLKYYGLENKVKEINLAGCKIARKVAGDDLYVAGSVGPLGIRIEPYGPTSQDEAKELFSEQVKVLIEGGVDLIVLETFSDMNEILQAVQAIKAMDDIPIIALMTVDMDGKTMYGTIPETISQVLTKSDADVIGLNCSIGPQKLVPAMEEMIVKTSKPLCVQPNAGFPQEVFGKKLYTCSPDYMAKYVRHYINMGIKYIGGCCGTNSKHIKEMSNTIKALKPQQKIVVPVYQKDEPEIDKKYKLLPTQDKSKLARKICSNQFVITAEIVPPKGCDVTKTLEKAKLIKELGIDAINIPDGPRAQSRMSAMVLAIMLMKDVDIEPVLHYCCRDRNLLGMQSDMLGAAAIGIRNLLLVTGDPPKMGPYPDSTAVFDIDSIGLTNMVYRFNHGMDLGGSPLGCASSFFMGVGANPTAIHLEEELRKFYWKVEAGAEYAISQPVFDVKPLETFINEVEKKKIRIPIIIGLWPLVSYNNAEFLNNEIPEVVIPKEIMDRMRTAQDKGKDFALEEGIKIAIELFDSIKTEVQGVQVNLPFGRVKNIIPLLEYIINNKK